ncbi:MAG TPA: hypothetical protein VIV11_26795 [Kofleriaceae bacterium]
MSLRTDVLLWAQRVIARKGSAPHVLLEIDEKSTAVQVQEAFHKIARTSHPDLHRHGLTPDELEMVTSAYATVAGAYQQMRSAAMQTTRIRPLKSDDLQKLGAPDPRTIAPPDKKLASGSTAPGEVRPIIRDDPRHVTPPGGTRAGSTPQAGARVVRVRASTDSDVRPPKPTRPGAGHTRPGTGSDPPTNAPKPASVSATGSQPPTGATPSVPFTPSLPPQTAAQSMSSKALLYYRKAELCLKRGDLRGAVLQLKLACAADPSSSFLRTALAEVETEVRKNP